MKKNQEKKRNLLILASIKVEGGLLNDVLPVLKQEKKKERKK
jgi:hypothetical protein